MSAPSPQDQAKGLFGALFDFELKHFVTLKLAKYLYILMIVLVVIGALIAFIGLLSSGEAAAILMAIFVVPLAALLAIVYVRLVIETVIVMFRISDNTLRTADAVSGTTGTGGASTGGGTNLPDPLS